MSRELNSPEYRTWRRAVYWRDKHKCQMPGCSGADKALEAHHIVRWVDSPKLRFVISNGITLCKTCHDSIHGQEEAFVSLFRGILARSREDYCSKSEKAVKLDLILLKYLGPQ